MEINKLCNISPGQLRSKKLRKKMILDQIKNDANNEMQLSPHPQLLIKYVEKEDIEKTLEICTNTWMFNKIKMLKINNSKESYKCHKE